MMDEYLAQIYGTGSGASDDLEKTAQATMLHKLAEEEGIDLSGLSEDQLDALAQQVIADDEAGVEDTSGGVVEPNVEEEAQAKFAEADFLGRVMAHAYTQELNKIAEEQGAMPFPPKKKKDEEEEDKEKTASGPIARAIHNLGGSVGNDTAEYVEKLAEARAEELAIGWLQQNGYIE